MRKEIEERAAVEPLLPPTADHAPHTCPHCKALIIGHLPLCPSCREMLSYDSPVEYVLAVAHPKRGGPLRAVKIAAAVMVVVLPVGMIGATFGALALAASRAHDAVAVLFMIVALVMSLLVAVLLWGLSTLFRKL